MPKTNANKINDKTRAILEEIYSLDLPEGVTSIIRDLDATRSLDFGFPNDKAWKYVLSMGMVARLLAQIKDEGFYHELGKIRDDITDIVKDDINLQRIIEVYANRQYYGYVKTEIPCAYHKWEAGAKRSTLVIHEAKDARYDREEVKSQNQACYIMQFYLLGKVGSVPAEGVDRCISAEEIYRLMSSTTTAPRLWKRIADDYISYLDAKEASYRASAAKHRQWAKRYDYEAGLCTAAKLEVQDTLSLYWRIEP